MADWYSVTQQVRERIMAWVPDVIGVTSHLAPKGEHVRQFLAAET